jgi:hypothetical protein
MRNLIASPEPTTKQVFFACRHALTPRMSYKVIAAKAADMFPYYSSDAKPQCEVGALNH